jgi:transposase-like protein
MRATAPAALQKKWQELIRQQEQSTLSVSAFCRQHGFSDQSFYNWRKRLAADEPASSPSWKPPR